MDRAISTGGRAVRAVGIVAIGVALSGSQASANIYVPSFVQVLTAPLPYSLLGFALVGAVPVLLAITAIEARVVRYCLRASPLPGLFGQLLAINTATSILGYVFMPHGVEIWPGLVLAFAISAVAEGSLLIAINGRRRPEVPAHGFFLASLRMNSASYIVMAAVLACLVYLPVLGNEDRSIPRSLHGTLVLTRSSASVLHIDLDRHPMLLSSEDEIELPEAGYLAECVAGADGGLLGVTGKGGVVLLDRDRASWRVRRQISLLPSGECRGISPNGRYACCIRSERPELYDLQIRRTLAHIPLEAVEVDSAAVSIDGRYVAAEDRFDVKLSHNSYTGGCRTSVFDTATRKTKSLGAVRGARMSPVAAVLAWDDDSGLVMLDLRNGHRRRIAVRGSISSEIAWSPDGTHIAYVGHPNPFTAQGWNPDVRVVDVRTGKSVTIWSRLWTAGASPRLAWLPR